MGVIVSADNLEGLHEGLELNMIGAVGNSNRPDGQVRTGRQVCFLSKNPEVGIQKSVGRRLSSTNAQRSKSSGPQTSVGCLPTTTQRKRSGDSCSGSVFRQFPSTEYQQNGELAEAIGIPSSDAEQIRGEKRRLFYRRPNTHGSGDDGNGSWKNNCEVREEWIQPPLRALQTENGVSPVTNKDGPESPDVFMTESENEGDALIVEDRAVVGHIEEEIEMQALSIGDEIARRRERRQAQALRVREGNRRKKEGRPRNYLLVDDYTGKPYGTGVGEWMKELMLLFRELDLALGNINQQPEGVLLEIVEWIQHTWEHNAPVKFKFFKEVIARGVTLRRRDLFKMLKNKEPKLENLSDRSWRILGRLLKSKTTIRKSENCSRANASRVHFGRTGPSGEVGVQERLRRKLRRSPEPEEISKEMARDKGYGGRSERKPCADRVMHSCESGLRRPF